MSKIIKVYFTPEADIDFINDYIKMIRQMFDIEDKIIGIPSVVVSDVIIKEDDKKGVDYPF